MEIIRAIVIQKSLKTVNKKNGKITYAGYPVFFVKLFKYENKFHWRPFKETDYLSFNSNKLKLEAKKSEFKIIYRDSKEIKGDKSKVNFRQSDL